MFRCITRHIGALACVWFVTFFWHLYSGHCQDDQIWDAMTCWYMFIYIYTHNLYVPLTDYMLYDAELKMCWYIYIYISIFKMYNRHVQIYSWGSPAGSLPPQVRFPLCGARAWRQGPEPFAVPEPVVLARARFVLATPCRTAGVRVTRIRGPKYGLLFSKPRPNPH